MNTNKSFTHSTARRPVTVILLFTFIFSLLPIQVFALPSPREDIVVMDSYSQRVNPGEESVIRFGGVTLTIPEGAVKKSVMIEIERLEWVDPLNPGMRNVTSGSAGYRFKPDGMVFEKEITLNLPYNTSLHSSSDVFGFFYDTGEESWEMIKRVSIDTENGFVTSETNHFTDFITSTIELPQSPDPLNFNPTSIKDIKAADPSSGITMIQAPTASNQGSANLSYPVVIPPGRRGMQPQIAFSYNSEGGNGWLGMGWNLSLPSVTVDTRWGVPRYDADHETESYLLDGEMLAHLTFRDNGNTPRIQGDKEYTQRKEGTFKKIIRHGNGPSSYWWEVIDKSGTRYFYGGTPETGLNRSAVLASQDESKISEWKLKEIRDTYGNYVDYEYTYVYDSGFEGGLGTTKGVQLYVTGIRYTGSPAKEGKYEVRFVRDREMSGYARRTDINIDARSGFKVVTADLLRVVEVYFESTLIRKYELVYKKGLYEKSFLEEIRQYGSSGTDYYTTALVYEEGIYNGTEYDGFGSPKSYTTSSNDVDIPSFFGGKAGESILGTNYTTGGGVHLYGGWSPYGDKSLSAGLKVGGRFSSSATLVSMMDINGDGLSDKIYREKDTLFRYYYRPNISTDGSGELFGEHYEISFPDGVDLNRDSSESFTVGAEAYGGGANVSANVTFSRTESSTYFEDINGDGLMDLIYDGDAYYNHMEGDIPTFTRYSEDTPVPIIEGSLDLAGMVREDHDYYEAALAASPPTDVLRVWTAPRAGRVGINGSVRLKAYSDPKYQTDDGVKVSIQLNDQVLWQSIIAERNFEQEYYPENVDSLTVKKGDMILFRVNSRRDARYDRVEWDPEIRYEDEDVSLTDANGFPLSVYKASNDFSVYGGMGLLYLPYPGIVDIKTLVQKSTVLSDDVNVVIKLYQDANDLEGSVLSETVVDKDNMQDIPIDLSSIAVEKGNSLGFELRSNTPVNLQHITWAPVVEYTEAIDETNTPIEITTDNRDSFTFHTAPKAQEYDTRAYYSGWVSAKTDLLYIKEIPTAASAISGGTAYFSIKRNGELLYKRDLALGQLNINSLISIDLNEGDRLFFEITSTNPGLVLKDALLWVYKKDAVPSWNIPWKVMPYGFNQSVEMLGISGLPIRGWSYVAYRGAEETDGNLNFTPVQITELKKTIYTEEDFENDLVLTVPMIADANEGNWFVTKRRKGEEIITRGIITNADMESTRRIVDYIPEPGEIPIAGGRGFTKIGTSTNYGAGAGFSIINGSAGGGHSQGEIDYIDMNGDRFPDVVGNGSIHFTLPGGSLEENNRGGLFSGPVRLSDTVNYSGGLGFSGNASVLKPSSGGSTNEPNGGAESSMPSLGLSISSGYTESTLTKSFMDVNGDGLPDRVRYNRDQDKVYAALNLGYSFGPEELLKSGALLTTESSNADIGLSLGFQVSSYGYGGGISTSGSFSDSNQTIADINGDGLIDLVEKDSADQIMVSFNTGGGLLAPVAWTDVVDESFSEGKSVNWSTSAYFTISIPIPFAGFILINPGADVSKSLGTTRTGLRDLNGDGFPDSIETYGENTTVAYNNAGLMGRLKRIEQPLGSDIRLSYEREGNTYNLPQNKWVLSGVEVNSGIADAPLMRQKFIYEDPNYDRYEREFLGFGGVITESIDEDGSVIRKNVDRYRNGTFFEKGLLDRRTVADSAGTVYSETTNKYVYFNVREQIWIYSPNFDSSNAFLSIAPLVESVRTVTYEPGNSGSLEQNIRYQYDRYGNVTLYEDEGGERGDLVSASVSYEYDLDNYIIANPVLIEVWNEGSLIRQRTAAFEPGKGSMIGMSEYIEGSQTTIYDFEYYPDGNLKTITFPYNYRNQRYSKTFEYENITGTYITRVSDAFGYSSTASYNYLFGLEEESFDLNGNRMKKEYDEFGRLSKVYGPYDEAIPAIDISYYTEVFPAYAVTKNKIHFDPANSETIDTSIIVDGIGRVIQTKKEGEVLIEGETTPKYGMNISGMIIFDALGRVTEEGQPVFEEGYIPSYSSGVELKRPTIKTYDILDRETLVELPDQSRISYDYLIEDGYRKTVVTDPKGNISNTYKDIRGNILKMEQYNEGEKITTRYEYNGLGEILRVEDTYGNLTEMEYDMLGRRTSLDNGDSGLLEYEYDSAGNLIYRIDPNLRERNEVIAYEYDYNRLEKTIYPDMPQVTYIYGESGAEGNRAGRLYRIDDESGWSEHSYGKLGETVRTVKSLNSLINGVEPIINETGFLFDYLGRMEEIAYTDGEVVSYGYDRGGQVTHVSGIKEGTAFNYIDAIHYDEFGQRLYIRYGNGVETQYSYDPERRWLDHLSTENSNGDIFQNQNYSFDAVGNILEIVNASDKPMTQIFEYDDLYQLTWAEGNYENGKDYDEVKTAGFAQKYDYDDIGNMIYKGSRQQWSPSSAGNKHELNYSFGYLYEGERPHAASRIGPYDYEYDSNGNLILKKEVDIAGESPVKDGSLDDLKKHPNGNKNLDELIAKWEVGELSKNEHPHGLPPGLVGEKPAVGVDLEKHPHGGPPGQLKDKPTENKNLIEEQYLWDDANRLREVKVEGRSTEFLYNAAGERTAKRGQQGETIYADRFTQYFNKNTMTKHIFVGETRVVSRLVHSVDFDKETEEANVYYYHPDHLGSTSYVTDYEGLEFEHMEYTPYGESWIDEGSNKHIIQYRFTAKELDDETGLYYYGARYLNPRTSRWISADPALEDYVPLAPVSDEAKRHNQNLPGMGGVFNPVNLNTYHYAGNNPVKYSDPTGKALTLTAVATAGTFLAGVWVFKMLTDEGFKEASEGLGEYIASSLSKVGNLISDKILKKDDDADSDRPNEIDEDTDLGNTDTWPKPPVDGELTEGEPSRQKPRERGERSLYDETGREWRPHKPDQYHPEGHWDTKGPGSNAPWENVPTD